MMKPIVALVVVAICSATISYASAHHSHAMFDDSAETTITGTVKAFTFTNPHVYLYVDVGDDGGEPVTYVIEMSHVQNMITRGIKASTFAPGDTVRVFMNPLRDGKPGGNYTKVIDADGVEYQ